MEQRPKILLSGVTGFLGSHTCILLLNRGYEVLGTMRDLKRADAIKSVIAEHSDHVDRLSFAQADLMEEEVWQDLAQGMDCIQHIASPFPRQMPKHEDDLIIPAKQGVLAIMKAAVAQKVPRVVLTSSSGAIVYGKEKSKRSGIYDEKDWTDVENKEDTTPYFRSKTIAEKAAWDFVEQDESGLSLSVVCPGAILGPVLEKDFGTSANLVIKLLDGSSPAIPKLGFDIVDVRSVADLLIRTMESEEAKGERFIGSAGFLSFKEVAEILRPHYPQYKIPKFILPNFAVRLYANFDTTLKPVLNDLGLERGLSHEKARKILNWKPLSPAEAVLSCAASVVKMGLV